jgi:hypothetical protein
LDLEDALIARSNFEDHFITRIDPMEVLV